MIRKFLLLAVACAGATAMAQVPTLNWTSLIDSYTSSSDTPNSVVMSSDGNILALAAFGSLTAEDIVDFNGTEIGSGTATTSLSANNNGIIVKVSPDDGSCLWSVYTKFCDITIGSCDIAPTDDGGAVVSLKMRYPEGYADDVPCLVDASGNETSLGIWNSGYRVYYPVFVKIDGDGTVEWVKKFDVDVSAQANATTYNEGTPDGVDPYGIAVDDDGNIYIGGLYRTTLIFTNAYNGHVTITPHNVVDWSGDSQTTCGDMFIVKLDNEGNYVDHIVSTGAVQRDMVTSLLYDNGKLYFAGNIRGENDITEVNIGGASFVPNSLDNILVGAIDVNDFSVDWANVFVAYPTSSNSHTTQIKNLEMIDGDLYVMGHLVGGFGPAGSSSASIESSGTMQEGFLIQYNANNGAWINGVCNQKSIGGYYGVFKNDNGMYVYGYTLGGVFIDVCDESTWSITNSISLISSTTMTAWPSIYNDGSLYSLSRCRGSATYNGSDVTTSSTDWGILISSWDMNNMVSSSSIVQANPSYNVIAQNGGVRIETDEDVDINIFNTAGQMLYAGKASTGTNFIPLSKGIYLVNDVKVIVQ